MENETKITTVSSVAKKLLSILLAIIMLFSITASIDLSAYAETSGDYEYWLHDDETIGISKYLGSASDLVVPSTINGKKVTSIDFAFPGNTKLVSIKLPDSVTSITSQSFQYCTNLKSISFGKSLEEIGWISFIECTSLTNLIFPDNLKTIGSAAFASCVSLKSINFSDKSKLKYLYDEAFADCKKLSDVKIPSNVEFIGMGTFSGCESLKSITIPKKTIGINSYAFNGCKNLSSIFIKNPNCHIYGCSADDTNYDGSATISSTATIYGYKNSTAQKYATKYNRKFVAVDGYNCSKNNHCYINTVTGKSCIICGQCSHTWNSGKITKAATCTATGIKTYTCTNCGETKTETIKATGHSYKTTVTQATTSKNGSSVTKCTKCGTVSKNTAIAYPKTVTLSATAYTYDGKAKKPTVTVKDNAGKTIAASNYTVAYSNNTNVGTATVKVTFKGNYSGSFSKTFKINPKNTSISSVSALYKGFTVKYAKQATQTTGYQVQYSTSSNFSNAKTVTVNKNSTVVKNVTGLTAKKKYYVRIRTYKTVGKTNYYSAWSGAKNVTTSSYPTSIALSSTSYTYDGKVKKPSVTVKHGSTKIASKYYTVSYSSGRKNVGTYTVTIKFKKPYSGTVKKTFKINPKNTSISGLTAQSKAFTVKLKKYTTQTTGYQIQYSTSSNFSNAKTVTIKNTTTSKKVTGLTGNKKYYVRIRTYKTVGKTNYYSGWSGAKTITTKK